MRDLAPSTLAPTNPSSDAPEGADDALRFQSAGVLTLGVEIEVQLVDWRTKDLCPAAPRVLAAARGAGERIAPEIFQSMLELRTGVCRNLADVTGDLHVGMRDGDHAMAVMNGLLPHLATLLALSSSSPFMDGQDTGLSSARATVFESLPTAGTPPTFADWDDFLGFYDRLERSRAVTSTKDLWWDVRPSPHFGTLEVRVCDVPSSIEDTLALVALVQCLAADITARLDAGEPPPRPAPWRLRENKWRAARWGLDADLVVDDDGHTQPLRGVADALVWSLTPAARDLGCLRELGLVGRLIERGTSSERQRKTFAKSRSVLAVVEALAETWRDDAPPGGGRAGKVAHLAPIGEA